MHSAQRFLPNLRIYSCGTFSPKMQLSSLSKNRVVLISKCHDIYTNLAFEDWIYNNYDFQKDQVMYVWRNNPCVVIGKHQNPWTECNIKECISRDIPLARRKSGGGTVYHDLGNANFTFFTSRKGHDRPYNLKLITDTLRDLYSVNITATPRDDVLLENKYKISGSASKIGGKIAYHHCTLLLDVDKEILQSVLRRNLDYIGKSSGTESVPASVINLKEVAPHISFDQVCQGVAEAYAGKGSHHIVDPSDILKYPAIKSSKEELVSWKWIYGKTPKFTVDTEISINFKGTSFMIIVNILVEKGYIKSVAIRTHRLVLSLQYPLSQLCKDMVGCRFWPNDILYIANKYGSNDELWTEIINNLLQIVGLQE